MIGFKTVYDVTTEAEFFVASASLTDEKYNPNGENMYRVDLIPFDEENIPCLYNVPLMVDYSSGKAEYCLPLLEDVICSGMDSYDFDNMATHSLISAEIKEDMLNIPLESNEQESPKTLVNITVDDMHKTCRSIDEIIEALKDMPKHKKYTISGVIYNE